jgi:hypothetical protein
MVGYLVVQQRTFWGFRASPGLAKSLAYIYARSVSPESSAAARTSRDGRACEARGSSTFSSASTSFSRSCYSSTCTSRSSASSQGRGPQPLALRRHLLQDLALALHVRQGLQHLRKNVYYALSLESRMVSISLGFFRQVSLAVLTR